MSPNVATTIAYVGAFVGLIGGGVALFNSWIAVRWKQAELANSYMKDFNSNPELVFAGRCLDWNAGKLALPEPLRAYTPDSQTIQHDRRIFAKSLDPHITVGELDEDPRIQIYRTSVDSFLSWLCLVSSALDRNLFRVADIEEVGYWVAKIESDRTLQSFIIAYGYESGISKLTRRCRRDKSSYQRWWFPSYGPPPK
jgi:hypothetical protein